MKKIIYRSVIIVIILIIISFSIKEFFKNYKPTNIFECNITLLLTLGWGTLYDIINSKDDDLMIDYHFGLGMYIRNDWLRHGNKKLMESINNKPWIRCSYDSISHVILFNFWHFLHNSEYDFRKYMDEQEKYYLDLEEPKEDLPNKGNILLIDRQIIEMYIQVFMYKDKISNNYYLYTENWGWVALSNLEFELYKNGNNKIELLKKDK